MKNLMTIFTAALLVGFLIMPALADDTAQKVGVGATIGLQKYRGEKSFNESSKFGSATEFYIRYGVTSKIAGVFNYGLVELESDAFITYVKPALEFKLLFSAFPDAKITPFVFTGAGLIDFTPKDPETDTTLGDNLQHDEYGGRKSMVLLGAGVDFFLHEYVALNAQADIHMPFTDLLDGAARGDMDDMYYGGKVGLTVFAGATDSDGDGIANRRDADPKHAEDFDCFEDEDGAPECDNDRDGVVDVADWAPNEPEDMDGYADWDGAPDPDNDGDGILDGKDKDPLHAEDYDKFQDEDGAPDYDNDNDGIPYAFDGAPNDPETLNGHMDWDGIPDEKPFVRIEPPVETKKPVEPQTIVVVMPEKVGEKIILRGVNFETGSDRLTLNSHAVLDNAVQILEQHPEIEIEVQGHTDSQGSDASNQDLSQRRANSVRSYLLQKGIAARRITAVGYGETVPIDTNETADGRAKNRRVEFLRLK